ncbi:MAG: AAA family ATPase, partial [Verrucomicrobia bacterium]|nr:AAA family ATPase [Verrucomicrobiota bacterium]
MKKLPIDVSDIETMITGNYIYVDKTRQIYDLITGGRLYFLSRPRRFGKSLLISTMREIFSGNRALFEGLWISKSDYDWVEHPVLHLDFSGLSYTSVHALTADLVWKLENIAKSFEVSLEDAPSLVTKLHSLVTQLAPRGRVVVLVDEYDYPLLSSLHSKEKAEALRDTLCSFFAALKSLDSAGYVRGMFITGVTKFSITSIFSGMNNLNDISLDLVASDLLGYTEEEIKVYFKEPIS